MRFAPFADLFATFSRPCLLYWFYVGFVSLWFPFSLLLSSHWLPLGSLLAPFGSLLVSLGWLFVPLALDFLIFGASWRHSSNFKILSKKIWYTIIFFWKLLLITWEAQAHTHTHTQTNENNKQHNLPSVTWRMACVSWLIALMCPIKKSKLINGVGGMRRSL